MSEVPLEALTDYLGRTRWFAGKGRSYAATHTRRLATVAASGDGPELTVDLVTVTYHDPPPGSQIPDTESYQVPLAHYPSEQDRIGHALIHADGAAFVYDALHDREAMAIYLDAFVKAADSPYRLDGIDVYRLPGHDLEPDAQSSLFSGEQSNSSVAFGEDSLLKLFRKVTPGANPDIEIHRALTEAGSDNVAALYGWLEVRPSTSDDDPGAADDSGSVPSIHLGMLQQFLRTASDGWDLAQNSARNLFAEEDLHAEEVGGDFAAESERLGEAIAEVHAMLRQEFPTATVSARYVAAAMNARLDAAAARVPELLTHAEAVRAVFDALGDADLPAQRVHGDLHLGQTLRTVVGWKVVDFEGEPAKPLSERVRPDSPWRDVAGMLRSFDYAAQAVVRHQPMQVTGARQHDYRAKEWAARNREAFLHGYTQGRALTTHDAALVAAYEADKAVYETVYEARNRPDWIQIPLAALARISQGASA